MKNFAKFNDFLLVEKKNVHDIQYHTLRWDNKHFWIYCIEGNFGTAKIWQVWQMTINSPIFPTKFDAHRS